MREEEKQMNVGSWEPGKETESRKERSAVTDFVFRPSKMRASNLIGVFNSLTFNVIFDEVGFRPPILLFAFCFSHLFVFLFFLLNNWKLFLEFHLKLSVDILAICLCCFKLL